MGIAQREVQRANQNPEDEHAKIIEAVRRGGLREAAKIKGSCVLTKDASWDAVFADVDALTSHSTAVVVGTPVALSTRLSERGNDVLTDFQIHVVDSLKGDGKAGDSLVVTAVGGRIQFEDGTSAEVRTPDLAIKL